MSNIKTDATTHAEIRYPGVAVNESGKAKDTSSLEAERTHALNNNPRNCDADDTTTSPD